MVAMDSELGKKSVVVRLKRNCTEQDRQKLTATGLEITPASGSVVTKHIAIANIGKVRALDFVHYVKDPIKLKLMAR